MRSIPWKQLLLSFGIVAVIVWRVPFAGLRSAFRSLEAGSLFLALFFLLVALSLRAYKWHRLMAAVGARHLRQSLRSLLGGFALGLITPGRLGELGRCVFVREHERAQVALLSVFDRLLDFWALLTSMGVSLFFVAPRPAAVFGVVVWFALLPVVMGLPALVSRLAKLAAKSRHFREHVRGVTVEMPRIRMPCFATLSVGTMVAEMAAFYFLLRAFFPVRLATSVATYPYIMLAGDLPLSFSGVGVREGAAALLLAPYAVPSGAAVDAALMWFVFAMLLPAALGTIWLVAERVKSQRRRNLDMVTPQAAPFWARTDLPQPPTPLGAETVTPHCEVG